MASLLALSAVSLIRLDCANTLKTLYMSIYIIGHMPHLDHETGVVRSVANRSEA
jgi:hypothetical protein